MEIERVIFVCISASMFPEIWIQIIIRYMGVKMEVLCFVPEFGFEIFFLYRESTLLKFKFCAKKTLVTSY